MATSPNPRFDKQELVEVFDTQQETDALVVQGLLESSGIESMITAHDNPQDILPMGGVVVRVMAENAEEARDIIEAYRQDTETETSDDDSSGETDSGA